MVGATPSSFALPARASTVAIRELLRAFAIAASIGAFRVDQGLLGSNEDAAALELLRERHRLDLRQPDPFGLSDRAIRGRDGGGGILGFTLRHVSAY